MNPRYRRGDVLYRQATHLSAGDAAAPVPAASHVALAILAKQNERRGVASRRAPAWKHETALSVAAKMSG